ncbi:Abi-like protein [Corynebacterium atrinae]|uniref:Abi family protein n=1 Tax=Corynebacterium atrinae TaxID=1336740 RepID=UPI0025B4DA3A|nr:Abi family protein [Corynebacterium atrinae]WJY64243.1 Abi-like protein [Corynebacterium atrinae]
MTVDDREGAINQLRQVSYYRLSGYWHPMRHFDPESRQHLDSFTQGASFELLSKLYFFDETLRHAILGELGKVELAVRAQLGHELGRIHPFIHLDATQLGAHARQIRPGRKATNYHIWRQRYDKAIASSREEFVWHHKNNYAEKLPIWAAVETMDWEMLSHLFSMAPNKARNPIARACELRAPQLESWLKCLNVLRNHSAHHARVFNRVFDIKPRLNDDIRLEAVKGRENRVFTQLTLIQYLHRELDLSPATALPAVLKRFPKNDLVSFDRTGAPENWHLEDLWTA